jgi:hypothetical protein
LPRDRDDDGRKIPGEFVAGEFLFEPDAPSARRHVANAIIDPGPELARQHAVAFNASRSPPTPKAGKFHHRSLRRGP